MNKLIQLETGYLPPPPGPPPVDPEIEKLAREIHRYFGTILWWVADADRLVRRLTGIPEGEL